MPIKGSHFSRHPPRIAAPRMKLNNPIGRWKMDCSPGNFPTSKIFLPQFLKLLGAFPRHCWVQIQRQVQHH
jgi:hypothetical protein